jgi:hypothetical protein
MQSFDSMKKFDMSAPARYNGLGEAKFSRRGLLLRGLYAGAIEPDRLVTTRARTQLCICPSRADDNVHDFRWQLQTNIRKKRRTKFSTLPKCPPSLADTTPADRRAVPFAGNRRRPSSEQSGQIRLPEGTEFRLSGYVRRWSASGSSPRSSLWRCLKRQVSISRCRAISSNGGQV